MQRSEKGEERREGKKRKQNAKLNYSIHSWETIEQPCGRFSLPISPFPPICHAAFCILHFPLLVLVFLLLLSIYEWSDFRCTSRARTCRVVLPPCLPTSLPPYSTLTGSGKCSERQCIQWSALSARNTWTEPQEEKTRSNNNKSEWGRRVKEIKKPIGSFVCHCFVTFA